MNRLLVKLVLLMVLIGSSQLFAQQSPLLDNQRWQEYSYGVSILPPINSVVNKLSVDDAIARITTQDGYGIHLFIKETPNEMSLEQVQDLAIEQMTVAYPSANAMKDNVKPLDDYKQLSLYFYMPQTKQGPWVTAQTFVQISPKVFVLFQLETPKVKYELADPVYKAVIASLKITDPRELFAQREKMLDAGHELLSKLQFEKLKDQLVPEQWFRFVEGDRDIGYMRIRQGFGKLDGREKADNNAMERMGFKIEVMARIQLGSTLYDSINTSYVSVEHDEEIWSIRTTERPQDPRKIPQVKLRDQQRLKFDVQQIPVDMQNTWVETGLLSNGKIQLNRRQPTSDRNFTWDMPPQAYLSQVDLYLLPMMLASQPDGQWGFYAYHPNKSKVSFRTERLEHLAGGRYRIYSRLSPEDIQEQVTDYEANGQIIKRVLPGGRMLIPAEQHLIERLWPQFVK
jgi:hypothetical protein